MFILVWSDEVNLFEAQTTYRYDREIFLTYESLPRGVWRMQIFLFIDPFEHYAVCSGLNAFETWLALLHCCDKDIGPFFGRRNKEIFTAENDYIPVERTFVSV